MSEQDKKVKIEANRQSILKDKKFSASTEGVEKQLKGARPGTYFMVPQDTIGNFRFTYVNNYGQILNVNLKPVEGGFASDDFQNEDGSDIVYPSLEAFSSKMLSWGLNYRLKDPSSVPSSTELSNRTLLLNDPNFQNIPLDKVNDYLRKGGGSYVIRKSDNDNEFEIHILNPNNGRRIDMKIRPTDGGFVLTNIVTDYSDSTLKITPTPADLFASALGLQPFSKVYPTLFPIFKKIWGMSGMETPVVRAETIGLPPVPPTIDPKDLTKDGLLKLSEDPKFMEEQLKEIEKLCEECRKRGKGMKIKRYYNRDKKTPRWSPLTWKMQSIPEDDPFKKLKLNFSVVIDAEGNAHILYEGKAKLLGEGGYGKVKFQQNIKTKEFNVVKVTTVKSDRREFSQDKHPVTLEQAAEESRLSKKAGLHQGEFTRVDTEGKPEKHYQFQKYGGQHDLHFLTALDENSETFRIIHKGQERKKEDFIGSFEERLDIALKVFQKMKIMHKEQGILHRDIKLENILYNKDTKEVTIIDYGLSTDMPKSGIMPERRIVGTMHALAPEIRTPPQYGGASQYSEATDVYAGGVLLMDLFGFMVGVDSYQRKPLQACRYDSYSGTKDGYWKIPAFESILKDKIPGIEKAKRQAMNKMETLIRQTTAERTPRRVITDEQVIQELGKIKNELDLEINRIHKEMEKEELERIKWRQEIEQKIKEQERRELEQKRELERRKKEEQEIQNQFLNELERNKIALKIKPTNKDYQNLLKLIKDEFSKDIPFELKMPLIRKHLHEGQQEKYTRRFEGIRGPRRMKQLCTIMFSYANIDKIKQQIVQQASPELKARAGAAIHELKEVKDARDKKELAGSGKDKVLALGGEHRASTEKAKAPADKDKPKTGPRKA